MRYKLFAATFCVFALSSAANAQSLSCHLGAQAGLTIASSEICGTGFSLDGLSARSRSPDFGLHTGCLYKIPTTPFAVGPWGEYNWRAVDFKASAGPVGLTVGLGNAWAIGARAGYVLSNGVMPYALIGYTRTELTLPAGTPISSDLKGWMMGGGIEVPLAKNLSFAGEARWTKYDAVDLSPVLPAPLAADLKTDALSIVGRLSVTLNCGRPCSLKTTPSPS